MMGESALDRRGWQCSLKIHNGINLLRDAWPASGGTRDPHILSSMLQSLCSVLLAQAPLATISVVMYGTYVEIAELVTF